MIKKVLLTLMLCLLIFVVYIFLVTNGMLGRYEFSGTVTEINLPSSFIESKTMNFNHTDALEDELSHFIDCILNNSTPLVSGEDGIEALKLGLQIEELINNKKRI